MRGMYESLLHNGGRPAAPPPPAGTSDDLAAGLYPEPAPAPKATSPNQAVSDLRQADTARLFYKPEDQLGPGVRELALVSNPTGTAQELARQTAELAAVAADLGMNRLDVDRFAALARSHKARPPTDEQLAEYERTSVKELREKFGADFDTVLKDAQALAQRDHRFKAYLEVSGLHGHPFVVGRIAELARTARARGQLK